VMTNKYAEANPGNAGTAAAPRSTRSRWLAIERAKKLFGARARQRAPHSGSAGQFRRLTSVLQPGDKVLGMTSATGGHLTHGKTRQLLRASSTSSASTASAGHRNDRLRRTRRHRPARKPKMITGRRQRLLAQRSTSNRMGEIARSVGALLFADIAAHRRPRRHRHHPSRPYRTRS